MTKTLQLHLDICEPELVLVQLHEIVGPLVRQDEHHGDADELVDVVQEIPFSEGFIRAGSFGRCVFLKKMTNMYEERYFWSSPKTNTFREKERMDN